MTLQLRLEQTHGFPGSVLQGTIISRPEPDMQFKTKSLVVRLLGRSKTRLPTRGTAEEAFLEGSVYFLNVEQSLYQDVPTISNVLEDGERGHFRIRFPEDATFKYIQANVIEWPRALDLTEARTLPPTGEFGTGNSIEYSIETAVIDKTSGGEITARVPVTFSLAREDVVPDPNFINIVQVRFLTVPRALETQKNYRSPDLTCSVRLALDGPTTVAQDHSFPLVLKLLNVVDDESRSRRAAIILRSGFIQLLQHTMVWNNDDYGSRWTDVHTIASCDTFSNGSAPQIAREGTDLATLFRGPSISKEFSPSFKCPNIERTYGLKVFLTVGFEEHNLEFCFDISPVAVLPGDLHCMARARQEDELWDNPFEERPFPDAVNKLRQKLGI